MIPIEGLLRLAKLGLLVAAFYLAHQVGYIRGYPDGFVDGEFEAAAIKRECAAFARDVHPILVALDSAERAILRERAARGYVIAELQRRTP